MLTLTRSVSREEPGKTRDTRDSLAVGGHVTRYTWQSGSGRRCRTLSLCWSSSPSTVGALNLHTPRIRLSGTTGGKGNTEDEVGLPSILYSSLILAGI